MMIKNIILLIFVAAFSKSGFAQNELQKDSLVKSLLKNQTTPGTDQGLTLIKSGDYENANKFLTTEINNDQSNASAYFKRGVASIAMSDTLNACRDWTAVLAMGDTAMYNL